MIWAMLQNVFALWLLGWVVATSINAVDWVASRGGPREAPARDRSRP
jgi:hypothetical protein